MAQVQTEFLRNIWYFALPTAALAKNRTFKKQILGEPVLFGRNDQGEVFALRDVCPHRGIPLSYGVFDGKEIECCYHGWRFDCGGNCTAIPSLTGHENIAVEKIRVKKYFVKEQQGCIWIFIGDMQNSLALMPEPLELPAVQKKAKPILTHWLHFPCFIDHAVIGLMDPAHGPFVHRSWWWRSRRSMHEKSKVFGPKPFGFAMLKHAPSKNSFAYKLLGGKPETEIYFSLPGCRIEHITVGRNYVVNLTTVTPINENETEIFHSIYTNIWWARFAKPLLRFFVMRFLGQDKDVVVKQQEGLKHESHLLLIRDADTQAKWYSQLKNEYVRAIQDQREFQNPVRETLLKWRS